MNKETSGTPAQAKGTVFRQCVHTCKKPTPCCALLEAHWVLLLSPLLEDSPDSWGIRSRKLHFWYRLKSGCPGVLVRNTNFFTTFL